MDCWWDCIKAPDTLKATLEFLTATRTTLELRNEICHQLMKMISEKECGHNSSRICAINELFDCATELRARIIGQNASTEYGAYKDLHHCCLKLHVCNGTYVAYCDGTNDCMYDYYDDGKSQICAFNIQACAKKIVCVLLEVLPKFYITLFAILARLWNDGTWQFQRCNDEKGSLYKLLTGKENVHENASCPYYGAIKLPFGFSKTDLKSGDRADTIEKVIKKLVGDSGCLRTLINMMKKSNVESCSSISSSIGTLDKVSSWYKCTCYAVDTDFDARIPPINPVVRRARRTRQPRSVKRASGRDKIAPSSSTSVSTTITSTADTEPNVSHLAGNTGSSANAYGTGDVGDQKYLYFANSGGASYAATSYYSGNLQELKNVVQAGSGSNCAASGAAVGCLLVGCVGVGAAYGFNIGGFGTMVNSLF
ncbi:phage tail protein [Babesia caballi]|uniref:Phage tail protein n=1 Tax=Babesia caballi TaxID=5871 RepID=A0AAV4M5T6_BABCB|nr:phage tail protein [Babesia caballi]